MTGGDRSAWPASPARVPARDSVSRSRGPSPAASLPGAPAPGGRECCPAADSSHAAGTVNKDVFPRVAAATAGPACAAAAGCGMSEAAEGRAGPAGRAGP